mmetsp:Transcript_20267/g.42202  ORF Transcript_20267/g.42202 Transcript_20267/m.42202 type:complete len:201 (-) Transcript_20267:65-667(-)
MVLGRQVSDRRDKEETLCMARAGNKEENTKISKINQNPMRHNPKLCDTFDDRPTKWNRRNSRRTRNSIRQTNIPILIPRTPMPLLLFPITTIPLRNWRRRHQTPCPNPVLLHRRLQNLKMPPSLQNVQDLTIPIRRLPQWQPAIEIDPVNSQSDRFGPRPFIFISIRDASSIGFLVGHGIIRTSITTVMFLLLMVIRPLE